jgi:hypothetical protein
VCSSDLGCKLSQCGPEAEKALLAALESSDANTRTAAAASILRTSNDAKLLGAVADSLKDAQPEMRMLGADAVFTLLVHGADTSRYIPILLKMIAEEPPATRLAAFEILVDLRAAIPREAAASFLKVPDPKAVWLAYSYLRPAHLSCDEAAPLLGNPLPYARLLGLNFLKQTRSSRAVELAMPLLRDSQKEVRATAQRVLQSLTAQNFALNHPEKWERWWAANRNSFKPSEDR